MCFCRTTAKARRFSRLIRDSQKKNIPFSFCRGEFGREGVGGGFFVPEDADDPPAAAVVEKLDAVDASGERLFATSVAGFVTAQDVDDIAEFFDAIDDGTLEKGMSLEVAAGTLHVAFHVDEKDGAALAFSRGGQSRFGYEEGAEAIPVAIAGGTGDDVIEGTKDGVDGFHVVGFGSRDAGGERGRSGGLLCAERR